MKLIKALVIFSLLISCAGLSANGGLFGWKGTYGTLIHLTYGSQSADLSPLNDETSFYFDATYPSDFTALGAQFFYISDDLILGLEGKLLSNGTHYSEPYFYEISGQAGFFDLGYVLYNNRYTFIAPWVGIGMGNITFAMASENTWPLAFDLQQPYSFSAHKNNLMLNWGLCCDFCYNDWAIGLTAGYMHPISESDWYHAGEKLEDGPAAYLTGFYFNINLGFSQFNLWSNKIN